MSTDAWLAQNNTYLAASLQWLRVRLQQLLPPPLPMPVAETSEPRAASAARPSTSRWPWGRRQEDQFETPAVPERRLLPEGQPIPLDQQIREAAAARESAAAIEPPPALVMLARRFGLSDFERDTLLLAAAPEFDPSFGPLCAAIHGHPNLQHATFGLAMSALDNPTWDARSSSRPLRQAQLIEVEPSPAAALTASVIRGDERIVDFLKGLNVIDERVNMLFTAVDSDDPLLSESQHAAVVSALRRLHHAASASGLPAVQLVGSDAGSKRAVARQICGNLDRRLYRVGLHALPQGVTELETLARLWQRETLLLPVALYVDADQREPASRDALSALARFLARQSGLTFVSVREAPLALGIPTLSIDVARPTGREQHDAWEQVAATAPDAQAIAHLLAGQFDLNLDDIRTAASHADSESDDPAALRERLWDACRDLTRPRLDAFAQRLDAKATWDDLVLPADLMALLRQIAGQVRERHRVYDEWGFTARMTRGFGITVLLAGESGTGKTMAAEVLANDLRMHLHRIDLSGVISKYIGETEQNLARVFDAAEQGGTILLFDEADALFGKRSEVRDSHDRYANIEINYLLQRMEAFTGLAILATNMKSSLDPAFMRRLRFVVNFGFPGVRERKRIWEKSLPPETPRADLDFDRLSRLSLTGGNIHSIALNAAFLAVEKERRVTMDLLVAAARMEMRKLDKPFNEAELR